MNWGKHDFMVMVAMTIAILSMSFALPALGMTATDDKAAKAEIPEFSISSDRFDFTGDFPKNPGTPSQGTMNYNSSQVGFSDNQIWLNGDTSGGHELLLTDNGGSTYVILNKWSSGSVTTTDNATLSSVGDTGKVSTDDYTIQLEKATDTSADSPANYVFTVDYKITEQTTSDGGFLGRIPVVGTLISAGSATAGVLAWLGSVLWFGITWIFEISFNLLGMLFDLMIFGIDLVVFISTTYTSVVSAASSWAAVFLIIPGVILSLELMKLTMVAIKLLPTT